MCKNVAVMLASQVAINFEKSPLDLQTATCGPDLTDLYREVAAVQRWIAVL